MSFFPTIRTQRSPRRRRAGNGAASTAWADIVSADSRTMFLAVDDETRVDLEPATIEVNSWLDAADSDFDFDYVSGAKPKFDDTYPVNGRQKTIQNNGASVLMRALATSADLLDAQGVGAVYLVAYIGEDAPDQSINDVFNSFFRHGNNVSWGGMVNFYSVVDTPPHWGARATMYDGATRTAAYFDIGELTAGWHLFSIRYRADGIYFQVDDLTEVFTAGDGGADGMVYLSGLLQIFNAYAAAPTTALALMAGYNVDHDEQSRDAIKAEIRSCIADV